MECELYCGVCREVYEAGEREPVVLPSCGHAFCRSCLAKLEEDADKVGSYFSCPNCRMSHKSPSVRALPPVFALLHLSENYKKSVEDGRSKCTVHGSALEFWCCECHSTLCGHCLLEGHVREGHDVQSIQTFMEKQWRDVRTTGARLLWELNQRRRALQTEVAGLVGQLVRAAHQSQVTFDLASRVAKILEGTDRPATVEEVLIAATLMGSLEHEVKNTTSKGKVPARTRLLRCKSYGEGPKHPAVAVTPRPVSISEADWREVPLEEAFGREGSESIISPAFPGGGETEVLEANTRPEDVETEAGHNDAGSLGLSGEESDGGVPEEATSPEEEWPMECKVAVGGGRQGRLRWEDGRVHAYAFAHEDRPNHLLLQLPFLRFLGRDAQPEVFLDVAAEEHLLGRVYIRLWGHLRRAHHFLALCMGTQGPSYRGSKFHGVAKKGSMGETLAGGRYLTDDGGNCVQGLVESLEWGGPYIREKTAGLVVAASGGKPEQDAFFHICTRDHPGRKFACAFGEVCAGMEVVHKAVALHPSHAIKVLDCGLVLPRLQG